MLRTYTEHSKGICPLDLEALSRDRVPRKAQQLGDRHCRGDLERWEGTSWEPRNTPQEKAGWWRTLSRSYLGKEKW